MHCVVLRPGGATGGSLIKTSGIGVRPNVTFDPLHAGIQSSIVLGAGVRYGGGGDNDLIDFPDAMEKQRHSTAKIDAGC